MDGNSIASLAEMVGHRARYTNTVVNGMVNGVGQDEEFDGEVNEKVPGQRMDMENARQK